MAKKVNLEQLYPRERQIMDIIFRLEEATANDVLDNLPDNLSNPAVRKMLSTLEQKGWLKHRTVKGKFFYSASPKKEDIGKNSISRLLHTFFRGDEERAVLAILKESEIDLSEKDVEHIIMLIDRARKENK